MRSTCWIRAGPDFAAAAGLDRLRRTLRARCGVEAADDRPLRRRRLSDMVEHVMTYAETQSGRKRYDIAPVDVMDVVDRAVRHTESAVRDANVTMDPCIDPGLPPVLADAGALCQCLQNLLSNAAKYGKRNESVHIEIEAKFDRAARKVRLSVTDHGPGVPEADVRHLFEPFHRGSNATTNTPGNGLGLHLVRKIVEAREGAVSYEEG